MFFNNLRLQKLASEIRKGESYQRFRPLAALFRQDALLDRLDRLDRWPLGPVILANLTGLIDAFREDGDRRVIRTALDALGTAGCNRHWDKVAAFLIGSVAAACKSDTIDTSVMPLQKTVEILAVDLSSLPQ